MSESALSRKDRSGFLALSAVLTGFDEVDLLATASALVYHDWLHKSFPELFAELLERWRGIEHAEPPERREGAVDKQLLGDPKLGPFAKAILVLWYTSSWNALPQSWCREHGVNPANVDTMFGSTYMDGLMWRAGGIHPQAAKPTGFASWARPPVDVAEDG